MTGPIVPRLQEIIKEFAFDNFGFVELKTPFSLERYRNWLEQDFHGEMKYLKDHFAVKAEPTQLMKRATHAIVLSKSYLPHPQPRDRDFPIQNLKVARYAQGQDYHHWLNQNMSQLFLYL